MLARDSSYSENMTVTQAGDQAALTRKVQAKPANSEFSAKLDLPRISSISAYAATSKVASRLNATAVSEKELQHLLDERQRLLDLKFSGIITRKEANRLEYIRWSLDRIEDAKYGADLDRLEEHVLQYENLVSEMTRFHEQLERHKRRGR